MNLTTLAHVKLWLPAITNTNSDSILNLLISNCSSQILAYLQRPNLNQTTFTDLFDGIPTSGRQMLRNWPVLAVSPSGVIYGSYTVPQASGLGQPGWSLETWDGTTPGKPQRIGIQTCNWYGGGGYSPSSVGYAANGQLVNNFPIGAGAGFQNLSISYTAGYVVQNESQTITSSNYNALTPLQPYGIWSADNGVTYANGTALVAITSGTPSVGQYIAPTPFAASPNLNYTFAAADENQSVLLTYSFIPFALEQGCIEWVGERFKYRDRIGLKSQSINGQETISYMGSGMPQGVKDWLDPYRKAFPM